MATILVAFNEVGIIGDKGAVPWHLPEDLTAFRKRTQGQCVIMGRKTWDSLPRKPLPDRLNIVLTRDPKKFLETNKLSEELAVLEYLEDAIDEAQICGKHPYIIGGAQIYEEARVQDVVDTVIATEVKGKQKGDTYFPPILKEGEWVSTTLEEYKEFNIVEYKRTESISEGHLKLLKEVARLKRELLITKNQLAAFTQQAGQRSRYELDYIDHPDEDYDR